MWTLPNLLTIARVIAAPLVAVIFLILPRPGADLVAFVLFALAAVTDYLDGWLARKWGQVSGFGRMLDPIADKAMVVIAGGVLMMLHPFDWRVILPLAAILLREVLVSGLREYLKGAEVLSVTTLAKWKTTAQLFAIGLILFGGAYEWALWPGFALLWVAALMTVITGWDYFAKGIAYIRAQEDAR
ncbi:MAG: CDP-diacylglycerol--glycerol-3-phosphate 3-phosphatidyltransferase [Pseudomonadota bacterium]